MHNHTKKNTNMEQYPYKNLRRQYVTKQTKGNVATFKTKQVEEVKDWLFPQSTLATERGEMQNQCHQVCKASRYATNDTHIQTQWFMMMVADSMPSIDKILQKCLHITISPTLAPSLKIGAQFQWQEHAITLEKWNCCTSRLMHRLDDHHHLTWTMSTTVDAPALIDFVLRDAQGLHHTIEVVVLPRSWATRFRGERGHCKKEQPRDD